MKLGKKLTAGCCIALALAMIAGCGSSSAGTTEENGVTTLVAANEGHTRPMEYVDEDGNLTGYEVDVLKAIDEELPQYKIKFATTEFQSIFTGIDSGRYQVGFNSLSKTKEREEKYIFPKHYDKYELTGLFLTPGLTQKHPVKTVDDLGGLRTVSNSKGDSYQLFVENFNRAHPDNPIKITYSSQDWSATYLQVYNGTQDFITGSESSLKLYNDEYGYKFDFVPLTEKESEQFGTPENYFIFPKTEQGQQYADDFDSAMEKLKDNGTLTKLSVKYFGKDYSGSDRSDW